MLETKNKVLRWVSVKVPFLGDIESFRTEFFSSGKDIFRAHKTVEALGTILTEQPYFEKKLKTANQATSKNKHCVIR